MALQVPCTGQELIGEINNLTNRFNSEIAEKADRVDIDNLSAQSLKTRFGGIEYISTADIPFEYKKYTPSEGEGFVGKISSVVDEAVYITYKTSNMDAYDEFKITLYLNNFDNTVKKQIWESSSNFDRAYFAVDSENNQFCISAYSSRTSRPSYTKVFRVGFDGILSELYSTSQYPSFSPSIVLCNNKLYMIVGTDSSKLSFIKIDYSDISNPIEISLQINNTVMTENCYTAFIKVIGNDLYLCFPTVFYKYIDGAIKNSGITRTSLTAPSTISSKRYSSPYNNDTIFIEHPTWFRPSECCWFLNDKFNLLSNSLFLGRKLWASEDYYKIKGITMNGDYLLVLESQNSTLGEQIVVLYMINCKTNECLWRCPIFDRPLGETDYVVLNSEKFEFSVCRTNGKMDTYKIIFSDEIGW